MAPGPSNPHCNVGPPAALPPAVPLFALIIGIDNYANCKKLSGAVADAKALKDYLEEVIRVPENQIRTLFDSEATRSAIIKAFGELQVDERIRHGDPIVIFYAGHGSELPAPLAWGVEHKIQCLLPHDYQPPHTEPIPDRSIGALIEHIAKTKGDNITVIFDCCHSASGTRDQNQKYVPRIVALNHNIPADLDSEIWGGRAGIIPFGFTYHGLQSHVLLAACGERELAYEYEGHGEFTTALLRVLKASTVNDLTYTQVFKRIHLPKQNPHCEGVNRHRVLFNARVSAGRQVRHSVRPIHDFKYVISAGFAHGVSHGVEFTLFSDQKQRVNVIEVGDTAVIDDFQTTVSTSVHFSSDSFAKLTRVGKVPFYLVPGENLPPLLKDSLQGTNDESTNATTFRFVESVDEAKLEVAVDGQRAIFRALDQRVNEFGLSILPHTVPLGSLAQVLSAAANYYWYLDLANKDSRIKPEVAVDFYPLQIEYDDYGIALFVPAGPGFCRKHLNSDNSESDVIDFIVDPDEIYGIKITNHTPWDLYLNAFLFNNSSLSIGPYYTQPSTGNPEAPLKRNGTFTLGYGPGGTVPFGFSLEEGQNVDVSYLKVFFATRPIDLSGVTQTSPLVDLRVRDQAEELARKARLSLSPLTQAPCESMDVWFAVDIPVVQRRQ